MSVEAITAENKELMAQIGIIKAEMNKYLGHSHFGESKNPLLNNTLSKRPDITAKKVPKVERELDETIAEYEYLSKRLVEIRDPMYMLSLNEKKAKIMDQTIRAKRAINRLRRMAAEDRKDIHAIEQGHKKSEILQEANDKMIEVSRIQRKVDQLKIKNKAFEREREMKEEREKELEEVYKNLQEINVHYFGGQILISTSLENLDEEMKRIYEDEEEYIGSNSIEDTRKKYYKDQLKRDIESLAVQNRQYKENLVRLEEMVKDQRKMMYEMVEAAKIGNNYRVRDVLERNDWMAEEEVRRPEDNYETTIGTVVMTEITEKDEENLESGQLNLGRISYTPSGSSAGFTGDLSEEIRRLEDRYLNGEQEILKGKVLESSIMNSMMKASNMESSVLNNSSSKNRILIRKVDIKRVERTREAEEKKKTPEASVVEVTKAPAKKEDDDVVVVDAVEQPEKSVVVLKKKASVEKVVDVAEEKPVSVKNSIAEEGLKKSEVKEVEEEVKQEEEKKIQEMPVLRVIEASEVEAVATKEVKQEVQEEKKNEVLEVEKEKTSETVVSIKVIPETPQEKKEEIEEAKGGEVSERSKAETSIEERIEVEESVPAQSIMQSGMNKLDETIKSYLLSATFTKPFFLKRTDILGAHVEDTEAVSAQTKQEEAVEQGNEEAAAAAKVVKEIETQTEEIAVEKISEDNKADVAGEVKTAVKENVNGNNNNKTIKLVIECTVAVNDGGQVQKIVEVKEEKGEVERVVEKVEEPKEEAVVAEKAIEGEKVAAETKEEEKEEAVIMITETSKVQEEVVEEKKTVEETVQEEKVQEAKEQVLAEATQEKAVKVEETQAKEEENAEELPDIKDPGVQKATLFIQKAYFKRRNQNKPAKTEVQEEKLVIEAAPEIAKVEEEEKAEEQAEIPKEEKEVAVEEKEQEEAKQTFEEEQHQEAIKPVEFEVKNEEAAVIAEAPKEEEEQPEKEMKSDSMVAKSATESNYQEEFEKETDKYSVSQLETTSAKNITQTLTTLEGTAAEKSQPEPVSAPVGTGVFGSEPNESYYEEIIVVDAETQTDAELEGYEQEFPPLTLESKKSEVPIANEENVAAFGELTRMNRIKRGEKEIGTTTEPILERKMESEATMTISEAQKIEVGESPVKEPELISAQIKGTERSATLYKAQNRSEKASAASQTPNERLGRGRRRPQLVSRGVEVNVGFERKEDVVSAFSSSYWGDSVRGGNDEGSMAGSMLIRPEMNSIGVGTDEVMENKGSLMEGLDLEGPGKYRVMNVSLVRKTEEIPVSKEV